jgi:hypothetical protein
MLTAAEVDRVRQAFGSVSLYLQQGENCDHIVEDPCVVNTATWDERSASSLHCASARARGDQMPRTIALLDSLGEGPVIDCPAGL